MSFATHPDVYADTYEPSATEPATSLGYGTVPTWEDSIRFRAAFVNWLHDTRYDSLPHMMKAHSSYQNIIALGRKAIPLIAAELNKSPSYLFLALEDLTSSDPVPDSDLGDLRATVRAWLAWLRR